MSSSQKQKLESEIFQSSQAPAFQDKCKEFPAMLDQVRLAMGLVARLRGPQGCPWDREQNHLSIRPYLIEEAYEVLAVLDRYRSARDPKVVAKETPPSEYPRGDGQFSPTEQTALKEELGDLLLQILLHSQMAWERGEFHFGDVAEAMAAKLVSRHPHVFPPEQGGGAVASATSSDQVLQNWEILKKREKKQGVLAGLPHALPSLQRASRMGEKAKNVGFDWSSREQVYHKVQEEWGELEAALSSGQLPQIQEEIGDLFFSLSQLARWWKIQPEDAHRLAMQKFEKRFQFMEEKLESEGRSLDGVGPEEWDVLWLQAKEWERQQNP